MAAAEDGGLRTRLRIVLLSLLDAIVGESSVGASGAPASGATPRDVGAAPKEVASMLKLLSITLSRFSTLLAGDGGASLLPELLERVLPLLARPALRGLHAEVAAVLCRILSLLHVTAPSLAAALARGTLLLIEDVYDVAAVLSSQPELSASVACYAGALRSTDSAEPPLQLPLDSAAACECLLAGLLSLAEHCLRLRPLALGAQLEEPLLERVRALLLCGSTHLQACALRFLAAPLAGGGSPAAASTAPLLDTVSLALRQHAGSSSSAPAAAEQQAAEDLEWWEALLALLQVLLDRATSDPATPLLLPRVFNLAAQAAAAGVPALQPAFCELCRGTLLARPALLESGPQLLQFLPDGAPACRELLLQCAALYLHHQQQLCGAEAVANAVCAALASTVVAAEAAAAAEPEPEEDGRSTRKRRRVRVSPLRGSQQAQQAAGQGAEEARQVQPPGPGLAAVAAAVAQLAAQLHERCRQVPAAAASLAAHASLLGLLAPLAPSQARALAMEALVPQLQQGSANHWRGVAAGSEQLAALLRLTLAALQAVLVGAAGGGEPATTATSALPPPQVLGLLQHAWAPDGAVAASAADGEAASPAATRALALCAGVAAVQADLLDASDLLELLQRELRTVDHAVADGGGGGDGRHPAAKAAPALEAAAALLPVACVIGGSREHLLASQPRATQGGGRRQKQHPVAPPPSPLVAALQKLLLHAAAGADQQASADQAQQAQRQAVLTAVVRGLLCMLSHPQDPLHLALAASDALPAGSPGAAAGSGSAPGLCQLLQRHAASDDFHPALSPSESEWTRQALEALIAAQLPTEGQTALVDAVALFLQRSAQGQLEHARPLVRWLLRKARSQQAALRGAVLRRAGLFAEPQVILALCHEGEHPIHTKDREVAVEGHEGQMLQALREALEAVPAASGGGSATEAVREGLVQMVGCVGGRMRSHIAHQLLVGTLVIQLDQEPAVRSVAAEALLGFAEQRKASLRDVLLATPKLAAFLGRQLPGNPALAQELADVMDISLRSLTLAILPQAVPVLVAENNRQGLEALAKQVDTTLPRLLREYGQCVVAREVWDSSPTLEACLSVMEAIMGEDYEHFMELIMPRAAAVIMFEAASAEDWCAGAPLPDGILKHVAHTLGNLSQQVSVAEFLADGDHMTRALKEWGDTLDRRLPSPASGASAGGPDGASGAAAPHMAPADARACVITLRCVLLLTRLAGRFIGRFLPQLMVLLTAGLRPANPREIKLQCLEGWHGLVKALAADAPVELGGVVNQIVVALLEPLQEGGPVSSAAIKVLDDLVAILKRTHRDKLRSMPPLPSGMPELDKLNETLGKERGKLTPQEQIELLIASLGDESMTVRATALRELRSVLSSRREWALALLGDAVGGGAGAAAECGPAAVGARSGAAAVAGATAGAPLLSRLLSALLRCCDPEVSNFQSQQAQQACAEVLGVLGAVDPARVAIDLQPPAPRCGSDGELVVALISRHLVRLLKTAPSLQVLDVTVLAIQELLRHCRAAQGVVELAAAAAERAGSGASAGQQRRSREATPADSADDNLLFSALEAEVQAIVRPYLNSKYQLRGIAERPGGTLFRTGLSFRKWIFNWLAQLMQRHASGELVKVFRAVLPVLRFDLPTALFLLPYMVHNVLAAGPDAGRHAVRQEIEAVLGGAASREGMLCCQTIFTLLDTLHNWHSDANAVRQRELAAAVAAAPAADSGQQVELGTEWDCIEQLLAAMPKQLLAQAASQCGAHARSLQYFESHVRKVYQGALNPAAYRSAAYGDAEVSYLQEVYGKLEEPDGLQGLVRLRQGGPRPEDQRLAAEKAGNWSEALTLYEQALQHSGLGCAGVGVGGGTVGVGVGGAAANGGLQAAAAVLAGDVGRVGGGGASGLQAGNAGLGVMQRGYLDCLLHIGHHRGLLSQVEGLAVEASDMSAAQLAALGAAASWRLGQWDLVAGYTEAANASFPQLDVGARWEVRIARLLWAVARRDWGALQGDLERARAEVMGFFSAAAMESYSRAYPHLVKLHMLQEVADVAGSLQREGGSAEWQISLRWEDRLRLTQSSLASQEPILALRRQLAALSGKAAEAGECWLQLAQLCRGTGHYETATTAVLEAVASRVPSAPLEHVQLLWDKGQPYRAVSEAQVLDRQAQEHTLPAPFADEKDHNRFAAEVALQLAQWLAETGQAAKDEIEGLFGRATCLEAKNETMIFRFAVFLDEVMTDARRRQEAERERGDRQKGLDRLQGMARIKLGEDKPFLELLPDVIKSYGMSMMYGSQHTSQSLPRMLTLWFEFGTFLTSFRSRAQAPRHEEKTQVQNATNSITALMTGLAKKIPMHTWLAALPQLISRMCHPCKEVSELVRLIIVHITQAYPHQSLWSLAAVSKSGVPARRGAASSIINAAKKNMDQKQFAEMNSFCDQLIRLATHQPSKGRTLSARKEFNHLVRSMPLQNIIMPAMRALSIALPPPPTSGRGGAVAAPAFQQPELVTIDGIVDSIEVMSSLQKPKKVTLIGSDGGLYTFLAKPKDDLRKDNRMMEAAGVLNRLFSGDPVARRRNLYLRRFAVLPIGEDNGIVEWVLNTTGLRHCLNEVYTAAGLFKGQTTNRWFQRTYEGAQPTKRRAEVLDEILKSWPALFHRWWLARFAEPAAWLNARLAYTRTSAVWCMVGHMVGLGDRHGENILIDCVTGDAVHVDFSCLFDKGLTLAKPEMVPFRLTQNVVDGFGVSGVEGVFRRVCEITLSVLRAHKGSILSHMDTFVHDPLVEWTRGSSGSRGGGGDEGGDNPHAKDALATIEGRLHGTLLGVSSQPCMPLSVEGHAHRLIEEASSKENLGMMYIWWMPWS
ncbi:serine threonine-kinase ATR isoform X1 [Micractinium conductrix]|uniref:Serine/threonine-protein kinase ATR n=1 Tax=Micractinium conductrix TaxID=554055 RepID=A0A2P6V8Q9_9CHLO|nr:serine threonine-kinase ATR isoform X1 [Micractinium conductrix]|eukprot:PSC70468.1 serine threonine-kinase ATR isoform X1 [Micractinium conductrix]